MVLTIQAAGAETPTNLIVRISASSLLSLPQFSPSLQHTLIVESSSYQPTAYIMAAPEVHHLFHHPIADHSFSADKQTLAVARDTSVELYGRTGSGFKLKDELKGHDKLVTSVDIALSTGRIVTCSQGE